MKKALIILILLIFISVGFLYYKNINVNDQSPQNVPTVFREVTKDAERVSIFVQDLDVPWAIAFLSNGEMLVTERNGQIKHINSSGNIRQVAVIDEVLDVGEGGLLGIALHPEFATNNFIYVYYTYSSTGNQTLNRVVRFVYKDNNIKDKLIIVDRIPGARNHNGGRIKFGPDGFLYIATGDAQEPSLAQNANSLAGKILRVTGEGKPAPGNPYNNSIYSYGHRNPQGLAWIDTQLWATEHGPSTLDELNRIEIGENYGWPTITGDERRANMVTAVINSGNNTWAPSGLSSYKGILYFAGLRGNALYSFDPKNPDKEVKEYFKGEYGRLRDVVLGPDGNLYITTSNRDGRGIVKPGDDKILRINPDLL